MSSELTPTIKNWLVEEAQGLLDRARLNDERDEKGQEKNFWEQTSQLRNMLQITQTESEVAVLRNFILYQAGRKSTKKFWGLIQRDVIRILEQIEEKFPGAEKTASRRLTIQHFFGYLVRYYVYLNGRKPPVKPHEEARESRAARA